MSEQFISERIKPKIETIETASLAIGTPSLPKEFIWRKQTIQITSTLRTWRTTGGCRHGSGEQYARRHWFEVTTVSHGILQIYFDRSTLGRVKEMGWWLFSKAS
jgi:hypothetical protein